MPRMELATAKLPVISQAIKNVDPDPVNRQVIVLTKLRRAESFIVPWQLIEPSVRHFE